MGQDFKADITLFLFYAPENESIARQIELFLKPFPKSLKMFQESKVEVGEKAKQLIIQSLETAQIIVPLISAQLNGWPNFHRMMEIIQDRHEREEVRIIPILAETCIIDERLKELRPLPKDQVFLDQKQNLPPVYTEIAEAIREAIISIRNDLHKRVTDLYNLALQWERKGDRERQVEYLQRALNLIPQHPSLLEAIGHAYFHLKRYRQANDTLAELLSIDPHHEEALKIMASSYFNRRMYLEAIDAFEKYLAFDQSSNDMVTLHDYINCLKACQQNEKLYLPYFWLARMHQKDRAEYDLAAKYFLLALDKEPTHYDLNTHFALFSYELGLVEYYKKHGAIAKKYAPANKLEEVEIRLDQTIQSIKFKHFPDYPRGGKGKKNRAEQLRFLNKETKEGQQLIKIGKVDEALLVFKTVLKLHWNNYYAQLALIRTFNEKKRAPHMAVLYSKYALEKNKENQKLMYQYAKALIAVDKSQAKEVIEKLLLKNSNNKSYINLKNQLNE